MELSKSEICETANDSAMACVGENPNCTCCSTDVDQLVKHYYLPVSYGIIFTVGLVGNLTSISIYLTKLRPWKSNSIIMVNLALADLLYVLSMPFLVYYYSNGDSWTLGDFMCRFVRFGFHFNLYGSILFLTCLAIFRYVVVIQPLKAAQVQQKIWGIVACLAVWAIAAAEIGPMLNMISSEDGNCPDFASSKCVEKIQVYSWLLTVFGFLLPLGVVFMCYMGIVRQLKKGPNTTSPCRLRARRVSVLILVVFIVCFLPYHILRALRIETRSNNVTCEVDRIIHAVYIISRPLAGFNTFFNLALYTLSGDNFRRAFFSTFNIERWLPKARSLLQVAIIRNQNNDMPAK
ncbi:2-oxoglutarate receptor 1-like [Scomber japonicus]|uniref:2-oxoglutarate receptor 1-like n=1 Tax=Scomber japonicus TaxID=13676 RepID=UPI0023052B67|nr:2-oxoglutarate receptor 1-like [Scomber japonicus]